MRPLRRELAGAPRTGTTVNSSAVALGVWSMVGGVSTGCGVGGASAIARSWAATTSAMMMRPIGPDPASEVTSIPNSPTSFSSPWRCPISPCRCLALLLGAVPRLGRCHGRRGIRRQCRAHVIGVRRGTGRGTLRERICSPGSAEARGPYVRAPRRRRMERSQHLPADRRLDINGCLGCLQSHQDVPCSDGRALCDIPLGDDGILATIPCGR